MTAIDYKEIVVPSNILKVNEPSILQTALSTELLLNEWDRTDTLK